MGLDLRQKRSYIDHIYSHRTIIQIEFHIPLCTNFVVFKTAFDSIRWDFTWARMRHYGLPEQYVRIFQAFFNGTVIAVRVNGLMRS